MRLTGTYEEWTVSQKQLSQILEVSAQRVNQLVDEKIVLRDDSTKSGAVFLIESMKNYYLSKESHKDNTGSVNFWKERGLHEKAKRELTELKVQERRGELYEAEIVEQVMTEQLVTFRTKLSGLPAKYASQLEGKTRSEIYDALNSEIESLLEELSESYKNERFNEIEKEAEDDAS